MELHNKKVLVTGGAGFIGSHLVDVLVKKGAKVTVVDNLFSGYLSNLELSKEKIIYKNIDIRDKEKLRKIMRGQEIVFHLAANADVPYSVQHPEEDFEINIMGSYNVLQNALKNKVKKIVFASSAAVYGDPIYTPVDEMHPTVPISPYGASKLATERLGYSYYKTYGLPFVTMRIFNTYGVRQSRYVMYDLLKRLYKDDSRIEVLGSGNQRRDYSYVSDTVAAFILAAESDNSNGQVYNIAGGKTISIKRLVEMLTKVLKIKKINIRYTGKSWAGDINVLSADISKIRKELKFTPNVPLDEGLERLDTWLKER
ncbi:MAG: SDR family NAD(P)-dependent oxidoreductase [Candidatus Microgenomates bacterium]|jgi:UDP-glucose 4-epimerase